MKDFLYTFIAIWLVIISLAIFVMPSSRKDLEGKSVIIHQDTLMITRAIPGDVLYLSNGAEISLKVAEKHLIN
jgi:hypothetical protein